MVEAGYRFTLEDAYMHEGRTGFGTIQIVAEKQGLTATREDADRLYEVKSRFFAEYPPAEPMDGAAELLRQLQDKGLTIILVTGSGTKTLLDRLNRFYPGVFRPELMVTGFDVRYGKPNPEPYLMALEKGSRWFAKELNDPTFRLQPEECVVVENAPLGVQAAVAAGIPTVAVNTGPLPDEVLLAEHCSWLFPSVRSLQQNWDIVTA